MKRNWRSAAIRTSIRKADWWPIHEHAEPIEAYREQTPIQIILFLESI